MFPTWVFSQIDFLPYQSINLNSDVEVVCIGDVNNDGLNDVVIGTDFSFNPVLDYKIFVYLQDNFGNLLPATIYSYPNNAIMTIDIGDVNNDQLNDIVIGYGDSIGIFYQNGVGLLNPLVSFYSGISVGELKIGDLNNDGLFDISVGHKGSNFIKLFLQDVSGFNQVTYTQPQSNNRSEIAIADVNSDGLNDVVYMAGWGFTGVAGVYVYLQNGSGLLNNYIQYSYLNSSYNSLNGIALGDVNNDGKNDVVATNGGNFSSSRLVFWFQDTSSFLLQTPIDIQAYDIPQPVEIADFNCDGKNEIIVVHGGWLSVTWYEQNINDNYTNYQSNPIPYASHFNPYGLSIGDINNDGKKDVAIANHADGLVLMINNTSPTNIDTSYSILTNTNFYSSSVISNSLYYSEKTIVTTPEYIITQIDSFKINIFYQIDSIRLDSAFITESSICGQTISDTIYSSYNYQDSTFLSIDTNLISTSIDSVLIEIEPPVIEPVIIVLPELVIPNTITPNGDGINDVWIIDNIEFYPNNELEIFNRNGSSIFKSINYTNNWNGQYNGQDLPATTYYYVIDLGSKILKGDLSIIRE
ncbi:MAG: VCBS repeat-containing protein [Flavobacteriales bacterium]|nr:VCBS repeat-containing protein [Flavobacteriales bacterium]